MTLYLTDQVQYLTGQIHNQVQHLTVTDQVQHPIDQAQVQD